MKKRQDDEIVVRTSRIYLRLPLCSLFYRRGRTIMDVTRVYYLEDTCPSLKFLLHRLSI